MDGILHGAVQLQTKNKCKYLEKRRRRGKQRTGESPIPKEEIENAVPMLKDGKSVGVDNSQRGFKNMGGPGIIDVLTAV